MKVGSLFAGIGGFDLAARWMGWSTAWYSEIDPYASAVMRKNFPGVPNLGDVRQIDGRTAPQIDMLVGGFPCQDISVAGKGAGIEGALNPTWVEWLMGFPLGWTALSPSETPSSLKSRTKSSERSRCTISCDE